MKKFLLILFLLFVFSGVKAYTGDTMVIKNSLSNVYYYYKDGDKVYSGTMDKIFINGNLVYKMDVKTNVVESQYSSQYDFDLDENIKLIAYFGYGYSNCTNANCYLAAQQLIWEYMGFDVKYYSSINGEGTLISYDIYRKEIMDRVNKYKDTIGLDSDFKFLLNSKNKINVKNNDNYELINNSENKITLTTNEINIETNKIGSYEFMLTKKYKNNGTNFKYIAKNSSPLLYIGNIKPITQKYNYEVYSGILTISFKMDLDKKCYSNITNDFTLYDSNGNVVRSFNTLFNNTILVEGLKEGLYSLKNTKNMDNYNSDKYYNFEINNNNRSVEIVIQEELKNKKITILKTFKYTNMGYVNYQGGLILNVYDQNNKFINNVKSDDNGYANIELYCGKYIIKSEDNEEILIDENNFSSDSIINFNSVMLKTKVRLYLFDENEALLKNEEIKFNDKTYNTLDLGYIEIDYIEFGNYEIRFLNKKENIEIKDNSEFYLEGNNTYLNIYLYKNKLENIVEEQKNNEELPNLFANFHPWHI